MEWIPTRCFKKCLKMTGFLKAVYGGASAGKTVAILPILYQRAVDNPGETITVVSDTLANLKGGAIRDFRNILLSTNTWDPDCWLKSESKYYLNNGSIIEFIGADDETKLRGPRRERLYVNEANRITWEVFAQMRKRTKKEIWIDWNPSGKFWYNQYVEGHIEHEVEVVNYEDNDWIFTPDGESTLLQFEEMKENQHLSDWHKNEWRVYGLGEWGTLEGACIKGYERLKGGIPDGFELLGLGLDFGTVDPNACVALYRNDEGRFLFDEVLYKNKSKYGQAPMYEGLYNDIKDYCGTDVWIYADYASPEMIDMLKRAGLKYIRKCKKGPDSIKAGIDLINDKTPLVTERSKNILEEFNTYRYKTDKDGNLVENKYEGPDHLVDACRYVLTKTAKKRKIRAYNLWDY